MKKEVMLWSGIAVLVAVVGIYKLTSDNTVISTVNVVNKNSSDNVDTINTSSNNDTAPIKELEKAYARVHLFNQGTEENSVEIIEFPKGAQVTYPVWYKRKDGNGGVVQYTGNEMNVRANIKGDGNLVISLKGLQQYAEDNKTFVAIPVMFTALRIDDKDVLEEPQTVTFENYYTYEHPVKDGQTVLLNIKWQKPDNE